MASIIQRVIDALTSDRDPTRHIQSIEKHQAEIKDDLSDIRHRTDALYRLVDAMHGHSDDVYR